MEYSYINIDYNSNENDEILNTLSNRLKEFGMTLNYNCAIAFSIDRIKSVLGTAPNNLVIVSLSKDYKKNIELKNELCSLLNTFLVKNTACSFAIESYLRLYKGKIDNAENFENECLIPDGAEPLVSDKGFVQGYMLNFKNINFCFIPPNVCQVDDIVENKLKLLLKKLYSIPTEFLYLKTFGINYQQVDKILNVFKNNSLNIVLNYETNLLDTTISIGYSDNIDMEELNNYVAQICESVKKYLYATEKISVQNMALDLLKISSKNISLVESITNGKIYTKCLDSNYKIAKKLITNHQICNSLTDLNNFPSIDKSLISQLGLYSVDAVYELTASVLNDFATNIAITSIASYDEVGQTCISIIAVGDVDGIHIYKNVYQNNLKNVQKIISDSVCYNVIKKLKQNDLYFEAKIN